MTQHKTSVELRIEECFDKWRSEALGGDGAHMSPVRVSSNSPESLPLSRGICELCVRRIVKIREQPGTRGFFGEFSHENGTDHRLTSLSRPHPHPFRLRHRSIKFQRRKHVNLLYPFKIVPYSAENGRGKPLCRFRRSSINWKLHRAHVFSPLSKIAPVEFCPRRLGNWDFFPSGSPRSRKCLGISTIRFGDRWKIEEQSLQCISEINWNWWNDWAIQSDAE